MITVSKIKNNIVFWFFLLSIIVGNVFYDVIGFKYIDEILILLISVFFLFFRTNTGFKKEDKELFVFIGIILFYLVYSIIKSITILPAILSDLQQQIKPFLVFYCTYNLGTQFNKSQRKITVSICLVISAILGLVILSGNINVFFMHPTNLASASIIVSYTYFFFSEREKRNIVIMFFILSLGLFSLRSKFYGEYVCTIAILFFIKSQIKISIKSIIAGIILVSVVLFFAWSKFNFYFVEGISEDIARPVLYKNAINILNDYFPLGSGFGTYGNEASRNYYSPLYFKYEMDNVWGLSPDMDRFVADTYYPTLSQFGYVGIVLFICFWKRVYNRVRNKLKVDYDMISYKMSLLIIIIVFIESVADTAIISNRGVGMMMLLAYIITLKKEEVK
jgi:hypothetical protein